MNKIQFIIIDEGENSKFARNEENLFRINKLLEDVFGKTANVFTGMVLQRL